MPNVELNPKDEFWVDPDKLVSRSGASAERIFLERGSVSRSAWPI
jgi:hypothetical protein